MKERPGINPRLIILLSMTVGVATVAAGAMLPVGDDTRTQMVGAGMFLIGWGVKRFGDASPKELDR